MTDYRIFREACPDYPVPEAAYAQLTERDEGNVLLREGGAAVVVGDRITFLAVTPEKRGQGIGSELLAACEKQIRANGYDKARVVGLFPGIPGETKEFFVRRGYEVDEEFVEMAMDIRGYVQHVCPAPVGVSFCFYDGQHEDLLRAVAEVDEEWVQYFNRDDIVLCGYLDGELASFCIYEDDIACLLSDGRNKVGSIGCVGTRPAFRNRGIGLAMVEYGAELLAKQGVDMCHIHYTSLETWYGRLGYRTYLRFWPGKKKLK